MQWRLVVIFFDVFVLTGFGIYMALTLWRLPEMVRQQLFAGPLGLLARLLGIASSFGGFFSS